MATAMIGTQLIRRSRPERVVRESEDSGTQVTLGKGQLWKAEGDNRWRAIVCLEGAIWVTQERDLLDHEVGAGEMFLISQRGKVVAEALVDARMQITPSLAAVPRRRRFEDTILQ
jgi:hypothetical protein